MSDWFSHRRLLEPIGNVPPAEAEEVLFSVTRYVRQGAKLKLNSLRDYRYASVLPSRPIYILVFRAGIQRCFSLRPAAV